MAHPTITDLDGLSQGARWRKCAFQVNPYAYLAQNHSDEAGNFTDEDAYNAAMVQALKSAGVEVIGTADHWCADTSERLAEAARQGGLIVFPGFEATTKDGVHLIVLFDPDTSTDEINRCLGGCGIPADCRDSRPGKLDLHEMLDLADEWHAVMIAPHVTTEKGLLDTLKGQAATQAWRHPRLHAVAYSGAPLSLKNKSILENTDPQYKRDHPVAVLRAADINTPSKVPKAGSSCWVKMSSGTIHGLDVAFRSPGTRIMADDPTDLSHPVLVGVTWKGGFLDGTSVRLNESFNVLVGGRGSGKSTVIESLRYAFSFDPVGNAAKTEHESMVKSKDVLGTGTTVSVVVEVRKPHHERFIVQRTVPNPAVVLSHDGTPSALKPRDLVQGMEIYGQRELAELARDKQKLTALLSRYIPDADRADQEGRRIQRDLKKSRGDIVQLLNEIDALDQQLEQLPVIKARLESFQKAGVAERLAVQKNVQREGSLLDDAKRRLAKAKGAASRLRDNGAIPVEFLRPDDATDLPNKDLLAEAGIAVAAFNTAIEMAATAVEAAADTAVAALDEIKTRWEAASQATRDALEGILRELQPSGVDAQEYLRLEGEVAQLGPLAGERETKTRDLRELEAQREGLLLEKETLRAERIRALNSAAKKVTKSLRDLVRVEIIDGSDRSSLFALIGKHVSGRTDKVRAALESAALLSPRELAATCRSGAVRIMEQYPEITQGQADALAAAGPEAFMLIEEIDLPIGTELQLNIRPDGGSTSWRSLEQLSTGQRATALLLLLLQGGSAPLIIDQPEDDLDQRFVYDSIVPRVRDSKRTRQLIFASHNANIPVLGDADQIVGLAAVERDGAILGQVDPDGCGSIDHAPVRALVEELLEGGREAFEMRRYLYGF